MQTEYKVEVCPEFKFSDETGWQPFRDIWADYQFGWKWLLFNPPQKTLKSYKQLANEMVLWAMEKTPPGPNLRERTAEKLQEREEFLQKRMQSLLNTKNPLFDEFRTGVEEILKLSKEVSKLRLEQHPDFIPVEEEDATLSPEEEKEEEELDSGLKMEEVD